MNGEAQDVQFASPLKTKEQCKTLAQLHRKNFEPSKIRLKRVSFIWKKTTQTIPMLAKAKSKISHKTRKKRAGKGKKL